MADDKESAAFLLHLRHLSEQVEREAIYRHNAGAQKYGPFKFLGVDTLQELYEEVLDLINYGRYTAIKIKLLQEALAEQAAPLVEPDTTRAEVFVSATELIRKGMGE